MNISKTTVVNLNKSNYNVYIGRGSKWGNPFVIGKDGTRKEVIDKFRAYAINKGLHKEAKRELKDKVLGCFCKPASCHGDLLAEWADTNTLF